jgi:hypothetical protein
MNHKNTKTAGTGETIFSDSEGTQSMDTVYRRFVFYT